MTSQGKVSCLFKKCLRAILQGAIFPGFHSPLGRHHHNACPSYDPLRVVSAESSSIMQLILGTSVFTFSLRYFLGESFIPEIGSTRFYSFYCLILKFYHMVVQFFSGINIESLNWLLPVDLMGIQIVHSFCLMRNCAVILVPCRCMKARPTGERNHYAHS